MIRFLAIWMIFVSTTAYAQHNHDMYHSTYMNWTNNEKNGCCNNHDCGTLDDDDVRIDSSGISVHIHGVGIAKGKSDWCPVMWKHYLMSGNSPDWSRNHACVTDYYGGKTPCQQFICFQPKPLT